MHAFILDMYGLPKLIEFESIKSPGLISLVLLRASARTFSIVATTYFASLLISPIFSQFKPSLSVVKKLSMGRGEPPRTTSAYSSKNLFCHPSPSRNSGKRNCGSVSPSAGKSCLSSPFLWSLSLSSLVVSAAMRSSREDRQSAIRCCSDLSGKYTKIDKNF